MLSPRLPFEENASRVKTSNFDLHVIEFSESISLLALTNSVCSKATPHAVARKSLQVGQQGVLEQRGPLGVFSFVGALPRTPLVPATALIIPLAIRVVKSGATPVWYSFSKSTQCS